MGCIERHLRFQVFHLFLETSVRNVPCLPPMPGQQSMLEKRQEIAFISTDGFKGGILVRCLF